MKIAIHLDNDTNNFCHGWIKYCDVYKIDYKIVDCYNTDIICDIYDCDALMWHWYQSDIKALLFAFKLTMAIELSGKLVFPDVKTSCFFDDKLGQKYLFESLDIPFVETKVYYTADSAFKWLEDQKYPIVSKLRGGAGSVNVTLVKSKYKAIKYVQKSFRRGINRVNYYNKFHDKLSKFKKNISLFNLVVVFGGLVRLFFPPRIESSNAREKGYVYFQKYLKKNDFDIRVVVIGLKAFALKRLNREGDFRASGSGLILYDKDQIPLDCIKKSFDIYEKTKFQSLALDFLYDGDQWVVIEVSYGFVSKAYIKCQGYWTKDLVWVDDIINPEYIMMDSFIHELSNCKK